MPALTASVPVVSESVSPAPIVAVTVLENECVPAPVSVAPLLNACAPPLKSMVVPTAPALNVPAWVPPVAGFRCSAPALLVTSTVPPALLLKFATLTVWLRLVVPDFRNVPELLNVPFGEEVQVIGTATLLVAARSSKPPALLLKMALLANCRTPLPSMLAVPVLFQVAPRVAVPPMDIVPAVFSVPLPLIVPAFHVQEPPAPMLRVALPAKVRLPLPVMLTAPLLVHVLVSSVPEPMIDTGPAVFRLDLIVPPFHDMVPPAATASVPAPCTTAVPATTSRPEFSVSVSPAAMS